MFWHGLAGILHSRFFYTHTTHSRIDRYVMSGGNPRRIGTNQHHQSMINGVPVEYPTEGGRQYGGDPVKYEGLCRLFAG